MMTPQDGLSTIPEEDSIDVDVHLMQLVSQDPALLIKQVFTDDYSQDDQSSLADAALKILHDPVSKFTLPPTMPQPMADTAHDQWTHYYDQGDHLQHEPATHHYLAALSTAAIPPATPADIAFPGDWWHLLTHCPEPQPGEIAILRTFATGIKQAVIERDTDTLTSTEMRLHAGDIAAADLKELQTWQHYKCMDRVPRHTCSNIIDCKWVRKWKVEEQSDGTTRRYIRSRLTVRGFKDRDADNLDTFAATSTRPSQRIVCSIAAQKKWTLSTADISKAFLQGITYQQLHEQTGQPLRDVAFSLPQATVPALQKLEGYAKFDPRSEVLRLLKPGTGLKDAPQCFSLRLRQVTKACGLKQALLDSELLFRHDQQGNLIFVMSIHVDDLKFAGLPHITAEVVQKVQATFGELRTIERVFTNCGVKHTQSANDHSVIMDQTTYLASLKPIVATELVGAKPADELSEDMTLLYMSLLGALAYGTLTRIDIAVYVTSLQRVAHKPTVIHLKRLNALTRWTQRNPRTLHYHRIPEPTQLLAISDSAFKREETTGLALRGLVVILCSATADELTLPAQAQLHILDFCSKKQRHVTRSTFAAELMAATDACDALWTMAVILHELKRGSLDVHEAHAMKRNGGLDVVTGVALDALSVYAAATAGHIKRPSEQGLLLQLLWLRQQLDTHVLGKLIWVDTRIMLADGLTKGSIDRALLHLAMEGRWDTTHPYKVWVARRLKYDPKQADQNNPFAHWDSLRAGAPPRYSPEWQHTLTQLVSLTALSQTRRNQLLLLSIGREPETYADLLAQTGQTCCFHTSPQTVLFTMSTLSDPRPAPADTCPTEVPVDLDPPAVLVPSFNVHTSQQPFAQKQPSQSPLTLGRCSLTMPNPPHSQEAHYQGLLERQKAEHKRQVRANRNDFLNRVVAGDAAADTPTMTTASHPLVNALQLDGPHDPLNINTPSNWAGPEPGASATALTPDWVCYEALVEGATPNGEVDALPILEWESRELRPGVEHDPWLATRVDFGNSWNPGFLYNMLTRVAQQGNMGTWTSQCPTAPPGLDTPAQPPTAEPAPEPTTIPQVSFRQVLASSSARPTEAPPVLPAETVAEAATASEGAAQSLANDGRPLPISEWIYSGEPHTPRLRNTNQRLRRNGEQSFRATEAAAFYSYYWPTDEGQLKSDAGHFTGQHAAEMNQAKSESHYTRYFQDAEEADLWWNSYPRSSKWFGMGFSPGIRRDIAAYGDDAWVADTIEAWARVKHRTNHPSAWWKSQISLYTISVYGACVFNTAPLVSYPRMTHCIVPPLRDTLPGIRWPEGHPAALRTPAEVPWFIKNRRQRPPTPKDISPRTRRARVEGMHGPVAADIAATRGNSRVPPPAFHAAGRRDPRPSYRNTAPCCVQGCSRQARNPGASRRSDNRFAACCERCYDTGGYRHTDHCDRDDRVTPPDHSGRHGDTDQYDSDGWHDHSSGRRPYHARPHHGHGISAEHWRDPQHRGDWGNYSRRPQQDASDGQTGVDSSSSLTENSGAVTPPTHTTPPQVAESSTAASTPQCFDLTANDDDEPATNSVPKAAPIPIGSWYTNPQLYTPPGGPTPQVKAPPPNVKPYSVPQTTGQGPNATAQASTTIPPLLVKAAPFNPTTVPVKAAPRSPPVGGALQPPSDQTAHDADAGTKRYGGVTLGRGATEARPCPMPPPGPAPPFNTPHPPPPASTTGATSKSKPGTPRATIGAMPRHMAMPQRPPTALTREVAAAAHLREQQDKITPRSLSDSEVDKDTFRRRLHRTHQKLGEVLRDNKKRKWLPDERNAITVKRVDAEDPWHIASDTFTCPGVLESASDRSPTPDHHAVPYRDSLKQNKLQKHHRRGTHSEKPPAHRRRQGSRGRAIAPGTGRSAIANDIPHFPAGPHDFRAHQRVVDGIAWQVAPGSDPAHPRPIMTRAGLGQVNMLSGKLDDVRYRTSNRPPREATVINCTRIDDPEKLNLRMHDGRHPEIIAGVLRNDNWQTLGDSLLTFMCTALDGNQVTLYLACRGNKHRSLAIHTILIGMCVHLGCYFHTHAVAKPHGKACRADHGLPCTECLGLARWSRGTWAGLGRLAFAAMGYNDAAVAGIRPQQRADIAERLAAGLFPQPKVPSG
jgi:hypothetical protein